MRIAHRIASASAYPRSDSFIGFIVALAICAGPCLTAEEPSPKAFAKLVAEREAKTEGERANYLYKQTVTVNDFGPRGSLGGEYREAREVIFSPEGERSEKAIDKSYNTLKFLKMTEEDFHDIRDIQPLLLTPDQLWNYDVKLRGTEDVDGIECTVMDVRPRQILAGQRLFEGLMWVDARDYSIVRVEGQAVPQIHRSKGDENLFPHFTTLRKKVGDYWFPVETFADDTLYFRTGGQRIRMVIRYANYRKFGAESKIEFK